MIKIGKYQHYKGKYYEVMGIARHSETLEEIVIYKALYESDTFGNEALRARPISMFFEEVMIDENIVPRFTYCDIENRSELNQ